MNLIFTICCGIALLIAGSCGGRQGPEEKAAGTKRPNILFIAVDDLNDWTGAMGGHPDALTPGLDRLAAEGVLFRNAYCQAPLCGPSRASLMTGLRPSTSGIYGMIDDDKIRENNEATRDIVFLPEYFRQQGYHTMGIGKLFHQHAAPGVLDESGGRVKGFGPSPEKRFKWDGKGPEGYGTTSTDWGAYPEADSLMPDHQSVNWAIERLERVYDEPFFLGVGLLRPHVPFYVPETWFSRYDPGQLQMPPYKADDLDDIPRVGLQINDLKMMPSTEWAIESGEWANIVQAYLACVSFADHQVERLLRALQESPHAENTIIVLWSDHGYRLGEKGTFAKHALWEEATRVPLMIAGPGIPEGKVINDPVELLSLYPTLLDLAGLPPYERNEGKSLRPLITDTKTGAAADEAAEEPYALTTYGRNNHAVRTSDYRYIRYEDGGEELYDHSIDPNEWNNLASDPEYKEIKERLAGYLPETNVPWTTNSSYNYQPYFKKQKELQSR